MAILLIFIRILPNPKFGAKNNVFHFRLRTGYRPFGREKSEENRGGPDQISRAIPVAPAVPVVRVAACKTVGTREKMRTNIAHTYFQRASKTTQTAAPDNELKRNAKV